ncbi:MAG: 30S ribosomal protein S20 [Candidatus Tantalella remota]|nr:30S ribosomal protein S20 [Candidatus Tantalella remota]
MANKKAAIKSLRQDKKKHDRNKATMTELRTLGKIARTLIKEQNRDEADIALKNLESKLQRAAKKDVIKKNNASRRISRLRTAWSAIGAKA